MAHREKIHFCLKFYRIRSNVGGKSSKSIYGSLFTNAPLLEETKAVGGIFLSIHGKKS